MTQTSALTAPQQKSFFSTLTLLVFIVTLFLSASIMFAIQPMVGKMLLPMVGGTPAGWIVAMAFFQVMLLIGYFIAHILSKVGKVTQGVCYLILLLIGAAFMPLDLQSHLDKVSENPGAVDVFLLLTFAVALPFIALSATSSTIQRLFTASDHPYAEDPYFLYATSNLGSFTGLFAYPLLAEPLMGLKAQANLLLFVYVGLITFALLCILLSARKSNREKAADAAPRAAAVSQDAAPTAKKWLTWLFLAFVPSSLLMAVTVFITNEILTAPMIWVLPLGLYLLTFIVAFARKPVVSQKLVENLHPPAVVMAIIMMYGVGDMTLGWIGMVTYLAIFTIAVLSCHMHLTSLRPLEENSKSLTAFYLMMSVGGALGGILVAFIVPVITDKLIEFPLLLLLSLVLHPQIRSKKTVSIILASIALTMLFMHLPMPLLPIHKTQFVTLVLITCAGLLLFAGGKKAEPFKVFVCGMAIIMPVMQFNTLKKEHLFMTRNFYGTIRVFDRELVINEDDENATEEITHVIRFMMHGTTYHGGQDREPGHELDMITYYGHSSPVRVAFRHLPHEHVALVGLGTGALSCLNTGSTPFTYIEIDPAVAETARNYFSYLDKCNEKAPPKIIIGDGRIEMQKMPEKSLDAIVLDAFAGDIIPTHLLTVEALKEYTGKLKDDGIIILHISNRFFDLRPIMALNAEEAGLQTLVNFDDIEPKAYLYPSLWLAIGKHQPSLDILKENGWRELKPKQSLNLRPWTDDYTNLMGMLKYKL